MLGAGAIARNEMVTTTSVPAVSVKNSLFSVKPTSAVAYPKAMPFKAS
jgi:hypothetical protein